METRNETIKHCAQIASEFTMGPDRSIHPDIPWDEMSEAAKLVAHTTAQQIAQAILQEIVEEPQAGKTLADFAKTRTPLFKRPMHRNPYGFTAARLTAEDLTANDWEEVTEEVSN
jgi:hypothetical protein